MVRSIVRWSLKSRVIVAVLAAGLLVFGVSRLRDVPLDVLPEFSPPYVEIQTESLGLSAEEVEQLITVPMEQDLLNGLPWVRTIRSESVPGLSSVVLVFEPGTDIMRARQVVAERMTQAVALPHVSRPPVMLQPMSATSRVMIVGLSSKSLTPIQMSVLARWTIVPRLMGVPGVANVAVWGQRDRQLQVQVDPQRLLDRHVSLLQVLETAGNALWVSSLSFVEASTPGTGGFIDTQNQRLGIRHILPIVSAENLAQVPIEGSTARLSDVANVVEDHQPLIGDALTQEGPGLLLVIEKFPGANALEVSGDVEEAFQELGSGLTGMSIDTHVFRPADFIESALRNVGLASLLGLLLLALVLLAMFGNWRSALVAFLAVPTSLVAAGLVLAWMGASFNTIVLTGLAIAATIAVFDAVGCVDHVSRRLREIEGQAGATRPRAILEACAEVRGPLMFGTVILLLALAPILVLHGSAASFLRPLFAAYGLALLASALVSLTLTPALCALLLRRTPSGSSGLAGALARLHESLMRPMLERAGVAGLLVLVLVVVAGASFAFLGRSMIPTFKERDLLIHLDAAPGTSHPEMTRTANLVCRDLREIPGVSEVGAHVGRAVQGDQIVNVNSAQIWVSIDPKADYDKTAGAIQGVVDAYPGIAHHVETYLGATSEDVIARAEDNVVVRVYGDEDPVLRKLGEEVRASLAGIPGVVEARAKYAVLEPSVETEVDLESARRYGLKPGDVRRAAAALLSGIQVGSLFEEQKVFDVVVWSTPATRHSVSSIQNLLIDTPGGGHARLGDVAHVRIVPGVADIRHEACKRYVDVTAEVHGADLATVAAAARDRLLKLEYPLEYHARVLGDRVDALIARRRLRYTAIAAAIGMLFLLQATFSNWRLAGLAFLSLPAALAGGLLMALLTGGMLSAGAAAGLIATFGLAVGNAIAIISHFQWLERSGSELFGPGLVVRGARERSGTVITSALAVAALLLPAVLLGRSAGLEVLGPMGLVTLGGLVSLLFVDLLLLPSMFLALGVRSPQEADPFSFGEEARSGKLVDAPATGS